MWFPHIQLECSSQIVNGIYLNCQVTLDVAKAQMDSVTGLYENKPSVAAVFPLPGPEAVEP